MMRSALLPLALAVLAVPAALSALPPEQETEHVVEPGETLNGIANRAGVPRDRIIEANGLKDPFVVKIGQTLKIPRGTATSAKSAKSSTSPRQSGSSLANAASYVVQPGDTLGSIALRAEIPRVLIAEANGLSSHDDIRIGQELVLPRTRRHTVAVGETGFGIAYKYGVPWEKIAEANDLDAHASVSAGKVLLIPTIIAQPTRTEAQPAPAAKSSTQRFAWPLSGPIRRGFTPRSAEDHHDGIDITADGGEAVRAVGAGKVIFARNDPDQFGNLVVIDHGNGWHSAYASLARITVKEGDNARQGERVGLVGDTSITRKTELHFELRKGGQPVDPLEYLPGKP